MKDDCCKMIMPVIFMLPALLFYPFVCSVTPKFFLVQAAVTPVDLRCVAIRSSGVHVLNKVLHPNDKVLVTLLN